MTVQPVPKLWPDSTIVCLGSGPSLTKTDIDFCRDRGAKLLAVNDAYRLCGGEYDALYAAEQKWWQWNFPVGNIAGGPFKFSLNPHTIQHPPKYMQYVHLVEATGEKGLDPNPHGIRHGGHSGYGAVNLAYHLGASRIILLGYDMRTDAQGLHHFFGDHPDGTHLAYDVRRKLYQLLYEQVTAYKVELVNATVNSLVEGVPRRTLVELFL